MKKLLIILLSAVALTAVAQQKKVAVYVTGEQTTISKVLGDELVKAFAKSGKYAAIERTKYFLAELGKEQAYQRSGAVDDKEIARLGVQFGVQLVCVADVSDVFGEKYVSTRLIDVESAEVVNTSNATSKLDNMHELLKVTEGLAKELTAKTVQEKAAEAAAKQKENEAIERMLNESFTKGYIKINNIYVATSKSKLKWKDVDTAVSNCRIGGFSDWRLPTLTELSEIRQTCNYYNDNRELYPNVPHDTMNKISNLAWSRLEIWLQNGYAYNSDWSTPYQSCKSCTCWLLLVRDAK